MPERKQLTPEAKQAPIPDPWGRGRPSAYREGYDDLVYKLRLCGLTAKQIAEVLEVNEATLYEWHKQHPSFYDAWQRGGDEADAVVARAVFHRAIGYKHRAEKIQFDKEGRELRAEYVEHYPPDTSAAIFWLTNRQRDKWKHRTSAELTGPNDTPLEPPAVTILGVVPKPPEST